MRLPRGKSPAAEPVHAVRRTGQPGPRFNYELFNCNNFNIRYWSWNYRGCWPFWLWAVLTRHVRNLLIYNTVMSNSTQTPSRDGRFSGWPAFLQGLARPRLYSFQLQDPKEPCINICQVHLRRLHLPAVWGTLYDAARISAKEAVSRFLQHTTHLFHHPARHASNHTPNRPAPQKPRLCLHCLTNAKHREALILRSIIVLNLATP